MYTMLSGPTVHLMWAIVALLIWAWPGATEPGELLGSFEESRNLKGIVHLCTFASNFSSLPFFLLSTANPDSWKMEWSTQQPQHYD